MSAFSWISAIIDWFGQFVPRWVIINTTHGGVKFVRGHTIVPLGPGFHFFWPLTTDFQTYPTARQTTNLRPQTLVTADGRTIIVAGMIVYRIRDIEAILARTFDPDNTIEEVALSVVNRVVCGLTWTQIQAEHQSGQLDRKLKGAAKRELRPYGVAVLRTTLTDLAPCRVLKLVGDVKAA